MTEHGEFLRSKSESLDLTFPVPWGVIEGKCWGDPSQSPVLMIHGLQDNAGTFDRLVNLLPDSFYYVCIDLPGHGKSTRFPKGVFLDFMLFLSSVRRVILQLEWKQFIIVGHSFGGQLGSYYAAFYPEEVKKLIMLDTLAPFAVPLDRHLQHCKDSIEKMIELEKKLSNSNPPNYTREEAINRLINSRMSPISKQGAEILSLRTLKKNKNNFYYFSTDQRLKYNLQAPITPDIHFNVISNITSSVLIIITNSYLKFVESYRKGHLDYETLQFFNKKNNFQIVSIPGHHDVHNDEPHLVAPHIEKFITLPKSVL